LDEEYLSVDEACFPVSVSRLGFMLANSQPSHVAWAMQFKTASDGSTLWHKQQLMLTLMGWLSLFKFDCFHILGCIHPSLSFLLIHGPGAFTQAPTTCFILGQVHSPLHESLAVYSCPCLRHGKHICVPAY